MVIFNCKDVQKNQLYALYSLLEGNKWNCTCGSGLDRAMVDRKGIIFKGKPLCWIPDSLRKTPIYKFTCGKCREVCLIGQVLTKGEVGGLTF